MLLVENVKKAYREPNGDLLPILDVPHLQLEAGEQVVIRGRSGGGKTTLLNVIAGLATPDSGRIVVKTTDVTRLPEAARDQFRARHIGFVFQTFNLLAGFTALENVLLGMTFTGQRHDSIAGDGFAGTRGAGASTVAQAGGPFGGRAAARGGRTGARESARVVTGG